ncbi:hypothetical protein POM88_010308 [Heracleum sosnowskyi]|uniref:Myosin motor domain-containing protein n=1 Tax=Heracleum sosnowskyi TaxID=360622 RepID=A0AAD8ISC5_9APIA|nr:hypothetical protein POM88_010308 [Heracleum sosnowskyi]
MNIIKQTFSGLERAQQTPDLDLQSNRSKPKPPTTFIDFFPESKLGVPNDDCTATPLFDVASVRIDSNQFKDLKSVQIYGTIILIDEHGNEFYIFNCKHRNDAKTLTPKTPTSVILQNFKPRGVPGKFCLLFDLKTKHPHGDANEDIVIFNDYKYMDCTKEVPYDEPQIAVFHNDDQYFITVTYTIFQCALLAEVGIVVEKTDKDDESGVAVITGELTRELSDDNVCTLLDVSYEKFDFGNYTPLSTLAVPAYSSLRFRSELGVNGEELSGGLKFEPFTITNIFHEKQIGGRQYRIRVIVYWNPGATSLTEAEILECYVKASETPFTNQRPTSKLLETNNAYYIQPGVRQYLDDLEWDVNYLSTELLEIFSISVCAYDQDNCPEGKAFSLKGKVECFDCIGSLCIFDSDSEGVFTSGDIVKLVPDLGRGFVGSNLKIVTDLKDNQGREVSFGSAIYNLLNIGGWRDKWICSVIRGQNGFAAVHYSIFTDAILAKLSLKVVYNFESGGATGCKVYGSVDTSYSNFNYSTHYAKKYYRSTLFEKKESDALELAGGEKVPLSKSVVAVPVYGLLVVEAIVYAQNDKHSEKLEFKETFSPAGAAIEKSVKKSRPGSFSLFMDVEWEALNMIHMSEEDQQHAFEMLAAVLWIGNISFRVPENENYVEVLANEACKKVAGLLGCSLEDLILALSTHKIKAGKETVAKKLTLQQAIDTRDALAKLLYASLFGWLVEEINRSLVKGKRKTGRSISILDIYGFESFEQHFNRHLFKLQQEDIQSRSIRKLKIEAVSKGHFLCSWWLDRGSCILQSEIVLETLDGTLNFELKMIAVCRLQRILPSNNKLDHKGLWN